MGFALFLGVSGSVWKADDVNVFVLRVFMSVLCDSELARIVRVKYSLDLRLRASISINYF